MAGKRANSEGSVYQRKDGRWVWALTLEGGRRFARKYRRAVKALWPTRPG